MLHEWPADEFSRRLLSTPRVVVCFGARWCPFSSSFLRAFEAADAEHEVPFAVADLSDLDDPRWEEHAVEVVPTLAFFDHGEELDRMAAVREKGLEPRDLDAFLDRVEALEEDDGRRRRTPAYRRFRSPRS